MELIIEPTATDLVYRRDDAKLMAYGKVASLWRRGVISQDEFTTKLDNLEFHYNAALTKARELNDALEILDQVVEGLKKA